ncbi:MAG: hypothetical protein ACW99U_19995 [Candidatus Thorarchaeota archaeon]|jgi:hypothetical protein
MFSLLPSYPYLNHILGWLKDEFSDASIITLNPTYRHPDICAADADIVTHDTLYDIKTALYPDELASKDMVQLLGYVSLAYYHMKHPIEIVGLA